MNPHFEQRNFDGPYAAPSKPAANAQHFALKHRDITGPATILERARASDEQTRASADRKSTEGAMKIAGKLLGDHD